MLQSFNSVYKTQFPYIGRITTLLLSLVSVDRLHHDVVAMQLHQQLEHVADAAILECLQENIASIITSTKEQNEQTVLPIIIFVVAIALRHE